MTEYQFFATTPKAMEGLLANEIDALGGQNIQSKMAGVMFQGDLEFAYKACLWLRTANRVLLLLDRFEVRSQEDLYNGVMEIDWSEHLDPHGTLAVNFNGKNNPAIINTHFGALKVKDAIVDQMRSRYRIRPSIDTERPSIRVNVNLHNEIAQISLDLSGDSLHKRGIRERNVAAPMKENLAAAILLRCGWPQIAAQGGSLLDPMCGSGTLLLEAAMIAADFAPGLLRNYFGFTGWKKHDPLVWHRLLGDAQRRKDDGVCKLPVIAGFDRDRKNVAIALQHLRNIGLSDKIHIEKREIGEAVADGSWAKGLLVCNPPYGERLGNVEQAAELYHKFGKVLKSRFVGWQAAIIIGNPELGFRFGLRSQKPITLFNGALECKLLRFNIDESAFFVPHTEARGKQAAQLIEDGKDVRTNVSAEMFANRLRKNLKKLEKWAKRNHVHCYRLYDADLPEYAVAVDIYQGEKVWVNVQEYEPPRTVDPQKSSLRLTGLLAEIPKVLGISDDQVFLKIRRKQKDTQQYEKIANSGQFHVVEEGGCKFLVNFEDYLDTGLFLDHRPIRLMIQREAKGKRFLNLFAYTGSASVHAIKGGAQFSLSIDMSNTYLDWAKKNFELNGIDGDHRLLRANCMEWLEGQIRQPNKPTYDLIFIDPPTFSNSKKMSTVFDIQNDHIKLLSMASSLLSSGGVLYFSTNYRKFKLHEEVLSELKFENITSESIPEDFVGDSKIHYCWRVRPCNAV